MVSLSTLCDHLAALPSVASLAEALASSLREPRGGQHRLRVAPLITAARVPVVAALAARLSALRPGALPVLLYVVATTDQALSAAEDLATWRAPERVWLYPAHEVLPYEDAPPARGTVGQRLGVLQFLASRGGEEPQDPADGSSPPIPIIVAPLSALLQPTLAPGDLAHSMTVLRLNDRVSQDTLLRRWLDQGYRVVPMVEEPGDMARRGGIVDLWPATDEQPVRIEWFGDEIDSLRRFDPCSQRSNRRLEALRVGPSCEIPFWQRGQALERLRSMDISMLRGEVREEWQQNLAGLETGSTPCGWGTAAPFFTEVNPSASLFAHLPRGSVVVLSEAAALAHDAECLHTSAEEQRESLIQARELPPDFPRSFLQWDDLFSGEIPLALVDMSSSEGPRSPLPDPPVFYPSYIMSSSPPPPFVPAPTFSGQLHRLVRDVATRLRRGDHVCVVTTQAARLQEMVAEQQREWESAGWEREDGRWGTGAFVHGTLSEGWRLPDPAAAWTLYTDLEIFGWRQRRPTLAPTRRRETSEDERAIFLRGLKPGDYVVHLDHGIAVYEGLLRRSVGDIEREYLNLRYAGGERLYVPVEQVDRVSRYVGAGDVRPPLTRLGTLEWELARRKARSAVQDLAGELLELYAQRKLSRGHAFTPDSEWQRDMEERFPFVETDDQLRALAEVKADMEAPQPMDRLICGDVGFGKTEVALRAAFKAVQDNKQVALLVPTTVLAQQHYETFKQRLSPFPVTVEMLSRFRSAREQEAIRQRLARGNIDIIVGTHRLLSRDVVFKDLGLLIIDEEQRFGVRHKERLKHLRTEVDVLTLTATPIPRTLHMSLAGLRDMSVIDTPPKHRVPIKTYVVPYSKNLVRDAIQREMERGGQVYFLHNRVQSIYTVADRLRRTVPDARIGVAHGQLEENQLEKAMEEFFRGAYDVLVCTTIIENGLDVPNANTIIIDNAPLYGLAQLYQLRGRVGRSTRRAYAYLLYPHSQPMMGDARQRLQAIQEATDLGAGFRIAMRDMEIRGVGNILGDKQSGHIAAVGYDLYSRLLEQAVQQIRQVQGPWGQASDHERDGKRGAGAPDERDERRETAITVDEKLLTTPLVTLTLPLAAYLPEAYIPDDILRLGVYQRMVQAHTPEAVHALRRELRDRFGNLPEPADHLMTWLHIKVLALGAEVRSITTTDDELMIRLPPSERVRQRLARRFGRDQVVHVGNQFVRLNRWKLDAAWVEKLLAVLEVMQPG